LGDSQKAIEDFNEALWINPAHKMAHLMRGLARYRLGQSQQAIDDCERIIEIDATTAAAYPVVAGFVQDWSI